MYNILGMPERVESKWDSVSPKADARGMYDLLVESLKDWNCAVFLTR